MTEQKQEQNQEKIKCPRCLQHKPENCFRILKNQKRSKLCIKCQEYLRKYMPKYIEKIEIANAAREIEITESEEVMTQIQNIKHTLFMLERSLQTKKDKKTEIN